MSERVGIIVSMDDDNYNATLNNDLCQTTLTSLLVKFSTAASENSSCCSSKSSKHFYMLNFCVKIIYVCVRGTV